MPRERSDQIDLPDGQPITLARVLLELSRIAFADPGRLVGPDGSPTPFNDLDDDTKSAVREFELIEKEGAPPVVVVTELHDKAGALADLASVLEVQEPESLERIKYGVRDLLKAEIAKQHTGALH